MREGARCCRARSGKGVKQFVVPHKKTARRGLTNQGWVLANGRLQNLARFRGHRCGMIRL